MALPRTPAILAGIQPFLDFCSSPYGLVAKITLRYSKVEILLRSCEVYESYKNYDF